jgi:endogenous inhibitor of DNA gyrase (YacG/DUF329 family)
MNGTASSSLLRPVLRVFGLIFIFGIPLLIAGLVLPVFMMRDLFQHNVVDGACPYCGAPIKTSDATIRLNCPACKRLIEVRETTLQPGE